MWKYSQSTGELLNDAGEHVAFGYSGAQPDGYNNPEMQSVPDVGPIPQGRWTIVGPPVDMHPEGPYVLHLAPDPGTNTFARSGFLVHGDTAPPGNASHGCIIFARNIRQIVWESGDTDLLVTA